MIDARRESREMQSQMRALDHSQGEHMAKKTTKRTKKSIGKRTASKGKGAAIIELLRRKEGATLADLTEATGWQPHSVRASPSVGAGQLRSSGPGGGV